MPRLIRLPLAYVVYFAAVGAAFPYLPVFYHDLGLDLDAIGAISAAQAATQLITAPLWGGLADRFPRSRLTLPAAAVFASFGAAILVTAQDLLGAVVGGVILFAGLAGTGPVLDARSLEILGANRERYGQVRAWGSVSFVVSATLVGLLLDREGPRSIFAIYLPALLLTAAVTATLPRQGTGRSASILRGAGELLRAPGIALFLGGVFLVWTSLSGLNAFYSIQIVELGGGASLVGVAWAVGAMVEVPIMFSFGRLARRFGTERLLILGTFTFAIRAVLSALAVDPVTLVAISLLEGLSFACFFVGGVTYIAGLAPGGLAGTAQGMFAAAAGLATIVGSGLGGVIAGWLGIPGLFAVCALAHLVAAGVVVLAIRRGPGPRALVAGGPA
ncbi:MAG TPA: MFS transporter [Candidatus Acidoferrum sp.]|nr:MFS transporter [Candidatus Acidoferrum sp.]